MMTTANHPNDNPQADNRQSCVEPAAQSPTVPSPSNLVERSGDGVEIDRAMMIAQHSRSKGTVASAELRAAVAALVAARGVMAAAARLCVNRHTMDRIRGGLQVHRSTLVAVSLVLGLPLPGADR